MTYAAYVDHYNWDQPLFFLAGTEIAAEEQAIAFLVGETGSTSDESWDYLGYVFATGPVARLKQTG